MNSRLISIIRKEFIQLFRDKRMLALILLVRICIFAVDVVNDLTDSHIPLVGHLLNH